MLKMTEYKTKSVKKPLDKALEQLGEDYEPIDLWLNAFLREQYSYRAFILQYGNWVKQGVLYQKRRKTILLPESLCLAHPEEAVQAHRRNREFTLENYPDELEQARESGLKIETRDLSEYENLVIPTKDFGSNKYSLFLFGGEGTDEEKTTRAQAHGDWLLNLPHSIERIILNLCSRGYINRQNYPYANQLWFHSLYFISNLVGSCKNLYCNRRLLGVKKIGEPTQNIPEEPPVKSSIIRFQNVAEAVRIEKAKKLLRGEGK